MAKAFEGQVCQLLSGSTAAEDGVWRQVPPGKTNRTFQASVSGTGAVSATVAIQVSNEDGNPLTLGTITLNGTTTATDGFASSAPWSNVRAILSAISGTDAAVNVNMGV